MASDAGVALRLDGFQVDQVLELHTVELAHKDKLIVNNTSISKTVLLRAPEYNTLILSICRE